MRVLIVAVNCSYSLFVQCASSVWCPTFKIKESSCSNSRMDTFKNRSLYFQFSLVIYNERMATMDSTRSVDVEMKIIWIWQWNEIISYGNHLLHMKILSCTEAIVVLCPFKVAELNFRLCKLATTLALYFTYHIGSCQQYTKYCSNSFYFCFLTSTLVPLLSLTLCYCFFWNILQTELRYTKYGTMKKILMKSA